MKRKKGGKIRCKRNKEKNDLKERKKERKKERTLLNLQQKKPEKIKKVQKI